MDSARVRHRILGSQKECSPFKNLHAYVLIPYLFSSSEFGFIIYLPSCPLSYSPDVNNSRDSKSSKLVEMKVVFRRESSVRNVFNNGRRGGPLEDVG
ncbi:hypothetical protein QQG55_41155 [Brugia pahangi]